MIKLLTALIGFWFLCLVSGIGVALGRYAYQEFLEFLYQDLSLIDKEIKKFIKKHHTLITTYRARMRQEKYNREELPTLRKQTREQRQAGIYPSSTEAIARRLMHVKHIRTVDGLLTGEEFARGQK